MSYIAADLSVEFPPEDCSHVQTLLANLGFEVVFANVNVNTKHGPSQVSKMVSSLTERVTKRPVPIPALSHVPGTSMSMVNRLIGRHSPERTLLILTRCTLVLQPQDKLADLIASENYIVPFLRNLQSVDCFVIRPANEAQFLELVTNKDKYGYDVISLDVSAGYFLSQVSLVTKTLKTVDKDIFIELELAQCFRTSTGAGTEAANTINQCRMFLKRMHGIVVSSGAKNSLGIRSVADLTNWGDNILGLRNVRKNITQLVANILKKRLVRSNFP